MKKYSIVLSLIFVIFYLLGVYLDYSSLNKHKKAYLKDLKMQVVDLNSSLYIPIEKLHASGFKEWGLFKSALLSQREKNRQLLEEQMAKGQLVTSSENILKNFKLTNRVICLDKECWEFMGIVKVGKIIKVTLLSKKKKSKLKTFLVGNFLLKNLKITEIQEDKMVLLDVNKQEKIILKLFDVDVSQYYPKKHKKIKRN